MVFVEVDAMMVHTTSVTATTRMLTVLADTTVTMTHMTTQLSGLLPLDIRLQTQRNKWNSIKFHIHFQITKHVFGCPHESPRKYKSLCNTKTPYRQNSTQLFLVYLVLPFHFTSTRNISQFNGCFLRSCKKRIWAAVFISLEFLTFVATRVKNNIHSPSLIFTKERSERSWSQTQDVIKLRWAVFSLHRVTFYSQAIVHNSR